jgi:hypothetical protein
VLSLLADLTPAGAVCLSVGVYAAGSVPVVLLAPADVDLRLAVRRAVASSHQAAVHAGHDLNWAAGSARHELLLAAVPVRCVAYSARELARDVAALLLLLTTSPKGALR